MGITSAESAGRQTRGETAKTARRLQEKGKGRRRGRERSGRKETAGGFPGKEREKRRRETAGGRKKLKEAEGRQRKDTREGSPWCLLSPFLNLLTLPVMRKGSQAPFTLQKRISSSQVRRISSLSCKYSRQEKVLEMIIFVCIRSFQPYSSSAP